MDEHTDVLFGLGMIWLGLMIALFFYDPILAIEVAVPSGVIITALVALVDGGVSATPWRDRQV